uniref:Uncharacterized protein n=1 Tax=Schistocephalus solidus TaxID=70667 RepID=A0A0V0J7N3_SCHSO
MRLRCRDLSTGSSRPEIQPFREVKKPSSSKTLNRRHSTTSPVSKRLRSQDGNLKVDYKPAKFVSSVKKSRKTMAPSYLRALETDDNSMNCQKNSIDDTFTKHILPESLCQSKNLENLKESQLPSSPEDLNQSVLSNKNLTCTLL